jgi:exodeoxyribonuclease VIII
MATVMKERRETFPGYRRVRAVNWSTLKEMARSPKHYRYRLENPPEETPAMRLGRAIHTAVLEPDAFPLEYVVYDGPRRAGKDWEEFAAVNVRKTILKVDEYQTALDVRDAVRGHKLAARLLRRGRREVTLQWTDPQTHMRCKGRLDHLRGDVLTDLKSTRDVDARTFGRLAARMGYIQQLAFYRRGLLATGHAEAPVYVVVVESEAPFSVAVYEVDDDALYAGDEIVGELLQQVKGCRKRRRWPDAHEGLETLDVPPWFFQDGKDEELILTGLKAREG